MPMNDLVSSDHPTEAAALHPEERLHEVAAILAAGLLRFSCHPQLQADEDLAVENTPPEESSISARNPLGLSPAPSTHGHAG